ncbi:hypothetical protein ANN_00526 [Periplaneta americana]|uniref:Uncharacterized protein n=1 Tax=Periplaneta americana TaxID=6978 RepID=A0ABQ8TTF6_PERAM|nr:hypothetical protein ANN_00526 [Periplaneta americana]
MHRKEWRLEEAFGAEEVEMNNDRESKTNSARKGENPHDNVYVASLTQRLLRGREIRRSGRIANSNFRGYVAVVINYGREGTTAVFSRSSTRVCVRICVSIRRPEFECSGPQLEGPEFEYSELSLKVCGSRYCELRTDSFDL